MNCPATFFFVLSMPYLIAFIVTLRYHQRTELPWLAYKLLIRFSKKGRGAQHDSGSFYKMSMLAAEVGKHMSLSESFPDESESWSINWKESLLMNQTALIDR